ncbi:MAG: hypothetical protein ACJ8ER_13800 [Allosphingosinicella sp.]
MDDSPHDLLAFEPVPSASARRDGWTPERQRAFIAALARCGSVSMAARHVGKSVRGVYKLRARPGAESFARAWDFAAEMGVDAMRDSVIGRAMHGALVPVVRRGRVVRMEHRYFDRMAIAVLSGRPRSLNESREAKRADDERRRIDEEDARRLLEAEVNHRAVAEAQRMVREEAARAREEEKTPKRRVMPRITSL